MSVLPSKVDMDYAEVNRQLITTTITVSATGVSARSAELSPGKYDIIGLLDACVQQGDSTVVATTNDHFMAIIFKETICVTGSTNNHLAVIATSASGTFFIQKVSP